MRLADHFRAGIDKREYDVREINTPYYILICGFLDEDLDVEEIWSKNNFLITGLLLNKPNSATAKRLA